MENFFTNAMDYSVFKKAMKVTDGESIIITVSTLENNYYSPAKTAAPVVNQPRKSMSEKFEPSPFGRFFGSPKKNTNPVDMSDFNSWKNKNYRTTEESLEKGTNDEDEDTNSFGHFSISDFLHNNSNETFNEIDQAKSDMQKPIEQLAPDDPTLKKFSLDSYMHKLEESILAKDKFEQNDDLLESFNMDDYSIDDEENFSNHNNFSKSINKFQDEDFNLNDTNIEKFAFDDDDNNAIAGNKFKLEHDELDKVKKRLARMEKVAKNSRDKANQKLIVGDFNFDEDEPEVQEIDDGSLELPDDAQVVTASADDQKYAIKPNQGKKLNEVVINSSENASENAASAASASVETGSTSSTRPVIITKDETPQEPEQQLDENGYPIAGQAGNVGEYQQNNSSNLFTKEDFKDFTNEFISKFSELYRATNRVRDIPTNNYGGYGYGQPLDPYYQQYAPEPQNYAQTPTPSSSSYTPSTPQYTPPTYNEPSPVPYAGVDAESENQKGENTTTEEDIEEYKNDQKELKMRLLELVDDKNKTDKETQEKLKMLEDERKRIGEEYQSRLKAMEDNYSRKYEEFKQKMYLEKANSEKKFRDREDIKHRKEDADASKQVKGIGVILKKEIKSNFNISNLEMEKKLLETISKLDKEENKRLKKNIDQTISRPTQRQTSTSVSTSTSNLPKRVTTRRTEVVKDTEKQPVKRTPPRRRNRNKTRKIDSDIIGGIKF